jgi:hypothetical protein
MMQLVAVVAFLAFSGLALANCRPVFGPEGNLFSQRESKVGLSSAPTD